MIGDTAGKTMVVNLKNGSVMKYLDPTAKQITGMVYCPQERAVLTASSNGQVRESGGHVCGCGCEDVWAGVP
jgi:hypothetical protein